MRIPCPKQYASGSRRSSHRDPGASTGIGLLRVRQAADGQSSAVWQMRLKKPSPILQRQAGARARARISAAGTSPPAASFGKGLSGECRIFRHPGCRALGKQCRAAQPWVTFRIIENRLACFHTSVTVVIKYPAEVFIGETRMKSALLPLVAALGLAGAAQAATYSVDVTANPFRSPGQPGLQTRALVLSPSGPQNFNGSTISFDLTNVGDSVSMDIYGLAAFESSLEADDLIAKASTASFDFGFGSLTIQGTSAGVDDGFAQYALADFVDGAINIGGGLRILVSLADTVFGTVGGVFTSGRPGIGFVNATFTLAEVPLPATLPLGVAALGLVGFAARRRRI
jgi:hypothetical protein